MNSKSDRVSHRKKEEKKSGEGRRYAQISVDSVNAAADSIGLSNLSEEASKRLSDDVSYRLREIIHKCGIHLRHANRSTLTADDINTVLQLSDAPRCYGYPPCDTLKYTFVKEARVFVADDEEVDLITTALRSEVYLQSDECYVKGRWVFPDNVPGEKTEIKSEETQTLKAQDCIQVLPHHLEYFKQIGKSLLGKSKKLFQVAVNDLKSNPNISPVAPLVVNLIAAYIHHHRCNGIKIYYLLQAIDALLENKNVDLRASDKSNTLVTSLLLFAINPSPIHGKSTLDDIFMRKVASEMIIKVLKKWHPLEVVLYVELYYNLAGTLLNPQNSLHSHLGSLYSMVSFGSEALDKCLWPNLTEYLTFLDESEKSSITEDIKGAILDAAERLFIKNVDSTNVRESLVYKCDLELQILLYDYFGDTICARHRWCGTPGNVLESTKGNKHSSPRVAHFNVKENLWTPRHTLKSLRCLPLTNVNRNRPSLSDVFESVECDKSETPIRPATSNAPEKFSVFKGLTGGKISFPQRIFKFHSSYSKARYIGKLGKKRLSPNCKNMSGNILTQL